MKRRFVVFLISVCMIVMLFPMTSLAAGEAPSVANIESIQAYTDFCFYGQKLVKVEIEYEASVDLSGVDVDTYTLLDRGYANPDFAEAIIESASVDGQMVTLNITTDTEALATNQYIYTGDDATGSRAKNPVGLYATGPWYRDVSGVIYYGNSSTDEYANNTTGKGYQTRECLELKLYHEGETEADAVCLANADGIYNASGKWLPTIDINYGDGGFKSFEELGIEVPTTATDGYGDEYVRGWAYFPEGYDISSSKEYPLIITITGAGTSYWLLADGTNNFGTGLNFDGSGYQWMDSGAIVLNIHDRSTGGGSGYQYWVDDKNVIDYFINNYHANPEKVTLTGNSRGTMAIGRIYREYPGIASTLIINNGSMGSGWDAATWQLAALNGTRIWAFDGELDTNNITTYQTAKTYYQAAGWSNEWIADNIRLTGYPTNLYYYWGETDHSTTKMTYWYFYDNPYYGPNCEIVDGELVYNSTLSAGDTYQLNGKLSGGVYNKAGFDYVVYAESLKEWVTAYFDIQSSNVGATVDPTFIITIPTSVNFGTLIKNTGIQEMPFIVTMTDSVLGAGAYVDVNVFSTFLMSAGSATLGYDLFNEAGVQQSNGSTYTSFTADGSDTGKVTVDTAEITQAGTYNGTMLFNFTYVG